MSEVYRDPLQALPIHGVFVLPLVDEGETKSLKNQAQVAGWVGLEEPAVGIALLVVCVRTVPGNGDQQPPIDLQAGLNGEGGIEQIGRVDVHEHRAAQHTIKFTIKWHAKIWKRAMLNFSSKFGVSLLGQLNEFGCGINAKRFIALAAQLSQVAPRPTANI